MNHKRDPDAELLDSTLAHQLQLHLPTAMPGPTVAKSPIMLAGNNHGAAEGIEDKTIAGDVSFSDTSAALYNLLVRYVDLLDGQEHGGWTLDEETTVRAAVTALSRSGWTQSLPPNIRLEALPISPFAPTMREDNERFVVAWSDGQSV